MKLETRWQEPAPEPAELQTSSLPETLAALELVCGKGLASALEEPSLEQVESAVKRQLKELSLNGPFDRRHNGDRVLGRICYAITRWARPTTILETGVCYGVTTACILQALQCNQCGHLHSIDLPPLGKSADAWVGALVPASLKTRWTLHRGSSRRLMPALLRHIGAIDLFLHDSLHTYDTMRAEFAAAWPSLRPGGVLISDDIEGNRAFSELVRRRDVSLASIVRQDQKSSLVGIAVKSR